MAKRTAEEDRAIFESMPLWHAIAILAVPTVLSHLVNIVYSLADTWFVGLAADADQMAAISLAFPIVMALSSFGSLFSVGGSSLFSRQLGKHHDADAARTFTWTVYVGTATAVVLSVVFWLLTPAFISAMGGTGDAYRYATDYVLWAIIIPGIPSVMNSAFSSLIRAQGKASQASSGLILGCVLNIALDPLFIIVLDMGVIGAAIASCISMYTGMAYLVYWMLKLRTNAIAPISMRFQHIGRDSVIEIVKIGTPAMLQVLLASVSNGVILGLVDSYATEAAAALGIEQRIELVPFSLAMGISSGVLPLIGYNYASGNHERMKAALSRSMGAALILVFATLAFLEPFAAQTVRFFIDDPATVGYGEVFVRLRLLALPFTTAEFMLMAVFQATGSARQAFILAIFRKGTLDIPLMFLMDHLWPLYGLMLVQPIMECIGCSIAVIMFFHRFGRHADGGDKGAGIVGGKTTGKDTGRSRLADGAETDGDA